MAFVSLNPATGRRLSTHLPHSARQTAASLEAAHTEYRAWSATTLKHRATLLRRLARALRAEQPALAATITDEVGKPIVQAEAEIEKSAAGCEYYAKHGPAFLSPELPPGAPPPARVFFAPLGVVLAIMPWNFPVWQAIRAVAPALLAGNTVLLKPAPNTAGVSRALERIFHTAGFARGAFQVALVNPPAVQALIADPRIAGVTLTGSTRAGRAVAAAAGAALKPVVLELGGSDAYVVLADADLDQAAEICAQARLVNSGQSCVAAKRFIVDRRVQQDFEVRLVARIAARRVGDPRARDTEVGPLARADLRAELHRQVTASVRRGARVLLGGQPMSGAGFFYEPTVLTRVRPGMPVHDEEVFGPVAAVIGVRDEEAALLAANRSVYGLGAAVFTRDRRRAARVAHALEAGFVAINDFVRSDPALPFGGVKQSGIGRELGAWGARSFVNVKTLVGATPASRVRA
ncbi:MAG TPA: aldehyde dehydrogenase family protein [Opitutus sp.]|nr:aldehyde dehydrogenase family protein [Opitutus sp.]